MHLKERQFQFHMLAILVKREDISRREDLCTLNFFRNAQLNMRIINRRNILNDVDGTPVCRLRIQQVQAVASLLCLTDKADPARTGQGWKGVRRQYFFRKWNLRHNESAALEGVYFPTVMSDFLKHFAHAVRRQNKICRLVC